MPIDTKKMISDKFTELFRQKGLDKVNVRELVAACGISRQAFYYHFRDILDVIQWGMEQKIKKISVACEASARIEDAISIYVRFFSEDRLEVNRLLDSRLRVPFQGMLTNSIQSYLKILLERIPDCPSLPPEKRDFALEFYSNGICQMLLKYSGQSDERDFLLAQRLAEIIQGKLGLF